MRVGVVRNPKSHANIGRADDGATPDAVLLVEPSTPEALEQDLQAFAQCGVNLLVIDGGDGTIRDVLSRAAPIFGERHAADRPDPLGQDQCPGYRPGRAARLDPGQGAWPPPGPRAP
jgi:hypothetical protein